MARRPPRHACVSDWGRVPCGIRLRTRITRESRHARTEQNKARLSRLSPLGKRKGGRESLFYTRVATWFLPITVVRAVVLVASTTPPPRTGGGSHATAGHAAPPARARRARPLPLSSPRSRPVARLRPGRGTVSRGRRPGVESVERPWSLVAAWSPPPREAATSVPTPCRDGRATFSLSSTPQRGRPHTQQSRNGNHETAIRMPMHT